MASSYQARVSLNLLLNSLLPLDVNVSDDRVATQADQGINGTEWAISWSEELMGDLDQDRTRLCQIDRRRNDGDEIAHEEELANALKLMGLSGSNRSVVFPIHNHPTNPDQEVCKGRYSLFDGKGWRFLPDPQGRDKALWASLTLAVSYQKSY